MSFSASEKLLILIQGLGKVNVSVLLVTDPEFNVAVLISIVVPFKLTAVTSVPETMFSPETLF